MTKTASRHGTTAQRRSGGFLARTGLVFACGLVAVPFLTTPVALQDMTSLLEGDRAEGRWQAFFIPSPAGAIEKAELAFGKGATRGRLPQGSGMRAGNGDVYTVETDTPSFDTPDETRVTRGQKAARVLAITPQAPPKAFSAGSILERQSLLRPGLSVGGPDMRTAFLKTASADDAVQMAMNFEPKRPAMLKPVVEEKVMVAALDTPEVPRTSALGYAPASPVENKAASLFSRILRGETPKAFIPPIGKNDHGWAATPLGASVFSGKEQTCLANGIYFEARGESELGQAAVAQVILNRVRNPTYPKSICGVVYQNKTWKNRCQFSFACDGIKDRITNKRAFSIAKRIAGEVTRGETWIADVGSATHYHANYVSPRWARAMKKVDKIGQHIFYRTFGGGWS